MMLAVEVFLVLVGAGVGAVLRYLIGGWVGHRMGPGFPWGTLAVNTLGCLELGFLIGFAPEENVALFILSGGIIGGFTTFSTLMFESSNLALSGQSRRSAVNIAANFALGFIALFIGTYLGATL
ncbi:MAG: CrcB family protein [Rubrobacter sp.]|nr:CrcB family protein [Rubrobacter sp.]